MVDSKFSIIVLLLVSTILLSGCADLYEQVGDVVNQIDPQGEDIIKATTARAKIIARGTIWVENEVPYDQKNKRDGYRTDCSGFISYAWELKNDTGQPISPDTVALGNQYASEISLEDIQGGDILNNKRPGNNGHTVLFLSWLNEEHTRFMAYEENGGYGKAIRSNLSIEYLPDGHFTIPEYDADAPGPYFAQISPYVP